MPNTIQSKFVGEGKLSIKAPLPSRETREHQNTTEVRHWFFMKRKKVKGNILSPHLINHWFPFTTRTILHFHSTNE
jgi:hypothetical protein